MKIMRGISLLLLLSSIIIINGCTNFTNEKILGSTKISVPTYAVKAPASGKILGLISEENERISKEQPLFAIADDINDQAVKDLTTQITLAEAELKKMEQGSSSPSAAIDLQTAQNNYNIAQQKAAKMNNLLALGAISRLKAQAAQIELQNASIQLQTATQNAIATKPSSPQSIEEQKNRIQQLKAKQNNNLLKQQSNEALSPCTGIITSIKATNNSDVKKDDLILQIQATETGMLTLNLTKNQIKNLKTKQKVLLKADSLPAPFEGVISNITGNTVSITTLNKPESITDGTTIQVTLP